MNTNARITLRWLRATRTCSPRLNAGLHYVLKSKWDLIRRINALLSDAGTPTGDGTRYQLYVTERILELPFAHSALHQSPGSRVLEFGCADSTLSIELAGRGMKVTGVDLRPHPLWHPNFTFRQGDFFGLGFPEAPFDAIVAISAVEHVGLGAYGEKRGAQAADRQLLAAFHALLRPGGQLIVTVPFGKGSVGLRCRIYDADALHTLLKGYVVEREEYYRRVDRCIWVPTSSSQLSTVAWEPSPRGAEGVALIAARRVEGGAECDPS